VVSFAEEVSQSKPDIESRFRSETPRNPAVSICPDRGVCSSG
jgi:hypothetical protein